MLAAGSDQNERQMGIHSENLRDPLDLVLSMTNLEKLLPIESVILQKQWTRRDRVQFHEIRDEIIKIPRPARDVKDRVCFCASQSVLQPPIKCPSPRERSARARVSQERRRKHSKN